MYQPFRDAFVDSLNMVPFLLLIYFVVEWLEGRFGTAIQQRIRWAGKAGPLLGALFGCIPQCGFSVVGSALYTRRLVTTGTLLAVFLSTSDEAVPVILAQRRFDVIGWILLTKIIVAIVAGYLVDVFQHRAFPVHEEIAAGIPDVAGSPPVGPGSAVQTGELHALEEPEEEIHVDACCGHHVAEESRPRKHWLHPLRHTAQVFLFIFLVSLGINLLLYFVRVQGGDINRFLLGGTAWQPVVTAIFGLIPNCAASVAIAELYLKNGIGFGAAVAGLCSSAGLGILVLLKDNQRPGDTLRVIGLLLGASIATGLFLQYLWPLFYAWIQY